MNSHKRYLHQANWTRDLRKYIFDNVGLNESSRALEVGCGTGAILSQINFPVCGLDLNLRALKEAKVRLQANFPSPETRKVSKSLRKNHNLGEEGKYFGQVSSRKPFGFSSLAAHSSKKPPPGTAATAVWDIPLTCGDALALPYADHSFEIVFCHFLLLWLPNPQEALKEMMRVTVPNGHIIAFAEPDYSERVDKPIELAKLGKGQADSLRARGANPDIGGKLAELCYEAKIKIVETGTLSKSTREASADERANEWETLKADLTGIVLVADIQKIKKIDDEAWRRGTRVLDVPTYYLWGKKKV